MKTNKAVRIIVIALGPVLLLLVAAVVAAAVSVHQFQGSDRIANGVTIAGVMVGGMSRAEAAEAVRRHLEASLPRQIEVRYGDDHTFATRRQLGVEPLVEEAVEAAMQVGRRGGFWQKLAARLGWGQPPDDIPVRAQVDREKLRRFIAGLQSVVDRPAQNAEIVVTDDDQVQVKPGLVGRKLRLEDSVNSVAVALGKLWVRAVELAVDLTPPDISDEQLRGLEVVLASYSTPFNPHKVNRTHNLKLGIAAVNKTVIEPGEVFSLNETVGERAPSRGFRPAMIFREGDVQPDVGGGMCQVSSTIYNAALLAGLDIVERYHHQRIVDYVPMGRDATVYWGSKDFKFKNNLAHPIMILGGVKGNRLWVKIVGKAEDKVDVKLTRTNISRGGYPTIEKPDPTLPPGKRVTERPGSGGGVVTLWREIYKDGQLLKKEKLHTDHFPTIAKIVRVGVQAPEGEQEATAGPAATTPGTGRSGLATDNDAASRRITP